MKGAGPFDQPQRIGVIQRGPSHIGIPADPARQADGIGLVVPTQELVVIAVLVVAGVRLGVVVLPTEPQIQHVAAATGGLLLPKRITLIGPKKCYA
jgi:hypothetical protein